MQHSSITARNTLILGAFPQREGTRTTFAKIHAATHEHVNEREVSYALNDLIDLGYIRELDALDGGGYARTRDSLSLRNRKQVRRG